MKIKEKNLQKMKEIFLPKNFVKKKKKISKKKKKKYKSEMMIQIK